MKRIILSLLLILIPFPVYAFSNGINIDCPSNMKSGSIYECTISGNTNFLVSAIEYNFNLKNAEIMKIDIDSSWQGDADDLIINIFTDEFKSGVFPIGKITIKPNKFIKNIEVNENKLLFGNDKFETVNINVKKVQTNSNIFKERIKLAVICVIIILIVGTLLVVRKGRWINEK